jgi:hypothetical protein
VIDLARQCELVEVGLGWHSDAMRMPGDASVPGTAWLAGGLRYSQHPFLELAAAEEALAGSEERTERISRKQELLRNGAVVCEARISQV